MKKAYIVIYVFLNENKELIQRAVVDGEKWKLDSIQEAENLIKNIWLAPIGTPYLLCEGVVPLEKSDIYHGVFYIQESYSI